MLESPVSLQSKLNSQVIKRACYGLGANLISRQAEWVRNPFARRARSDVIRRVRICILQLELGIDRFHALALLQASPSLSWSLGCPSITSSFNRSFACASAKVTDRLRADRLSRGEAKLQLRLELKLELTESDFHIRPPVSCALF